MEAGKRAVASAKAGTEKAKAALQVKAEEKLTASHPAEKEAAEAEVAKRKPGAAEEQPIAIATVTVRPSAAEHNPRAAGVGQGYT